MHINAAYFYYKRTNVESIIGLKWVHHMCLDSDETCDGLKWVHISMVSWEHQAALASKMRPGFCVGPHLESTGFSLKPSMDSNETTFFGGHFLVGTPAGFGSTFFDGARVVCEHYVDSFCTWEQQGKMARLK